MCVSLVMFGVLSLHVERLSVYSYIRATNPRIGTHFEDLLLQSLLVKFTVSLEILTENGWHTVRI